FSGGSVMNDDFRASNLVLDFDEFWRTRGPGIVVKMKCERMRFFDARGLQATPAQQIDSDDAVAEGFAGGLKAGAADYAPKL
ncbi:acyl transferase, partial [Burkholderia pseudomallei]